MAMTKRMTIDIAFKRNTNLADFGLFNRKRNRIIRNHLREHYPNRVLIRVRKQKVIRKDVNIKVVRFWVDTKTRQRG
jgi:hypothetical protein